MRDVDCESFGFWLDPICVPLNSRLKMVAVSRMDEVYKNAEKVIVLDRRLVRCEGRNITKLMSVLLSDWMSRLWTPQETLFPQERLYIALADCILRASHIMIDTQDWSTVTGLFLRTDIHVSCSSYLNRLANGDRLLSIVENFHNRVTSKVEDEYICLAILMDVPINQLPDNFRLHHVVGRLPSIPQDLVFAPGPRTSVAGFKWLPATLLRKDVRKTYELSQV